jgi:hypothetical protein
LVGVGVTQDASKGSIPTSFVATTMKRRGGKKKLLSAGNGK